MATVDPWTDDGGDNTEYFHTNHLGTTRFMSDPDGDPVDAAVYTAFGERVSGTNHRYGYAGAWGYQAHDFPSADPIPYLHIGARYYDPASGRFLQRDPIGIFGGLNVYEYAASNPSAHIDPLGLDDEKEDEKKPPTPPNPAPPTPPKPAAPPPQKSGWQKKIKKALKHVWDVAKTLPGYILPSSPIPADAAPGIAHCIAYDALRRHTSKAHEDGLPDPNCPTCKKLTPKSQEKRW